MANRVIALKTKVPKTKLCEKGNACPFYKAGNCNFAHSIEELEIPSCRFGNDCKNSDCKFKHPPRRVVTAERSPLGITHSSNPIPKPTNYKTTMCTFGEKCPRGDRCNFAHNESELRKLPCHFGASCRKPDCTFEHPPKTSPVVSPKPIQTVPNLTTDFPSTIPTVFRDQPSVWEKVQSSSVVSSDDNIVSWSAPTGDSISKKHLLCAHFVDGTICPHQQRRGGCSFAHGSNEQITQQVDKENDLCTSGDKCLYGKNCRFAFHSAAELVEFVHRRAASEKSQNDSDPPREIVENNETMVALPRKDHEQINGYWYISGKTMIKTKVHAH